MLGLSFRVERTSCQPHRAQNFRPVHRKKDPFPCVHWAPCLAITSFFLSFTFLFFSFFFEIQTSFFCCCVSIWKLGWGRGRGFSPHTVRKSPLLRARRSVLAPSPARCGEERASRHLPRLRPSPRWGWLGKSPRSLSALSFHETLE